MSTESKIQDIRLAFKELSATDQRDAIKGILLEHAYYLGVEGLSFIEVNLTEMYNWYLEGRKHKDNE